MNVPTELPVLVSVVIPVGRVDEWLDQAVESVRASVGVDWELILVFNNGAEVPRDWAPLSDRRMRVLYHAESLGPAGAGQSGIDSARGEFIAHLDADDLMAPNRLRRQVDWLRAHPSAVLVSSLVRKIDESGAPVGSFSLPYGPDVRAALVAVNVAPHSAWMMRANAARAIGGYDRTMAQMEDYDFLLRLGVLGPIGVLAEELTDYRLHSGQLSRSVRPNGQYVTQIADRRRQLAAAIGMPRRRTFFARLRWEAEQWTMYWGRKIQRVIDR